MFERCLAESLEKKILVLLSCCFSLISAVLVWSWSGPPNVLVWSGSEYSTVLMSRLVGAYAGLASCWGRRRFSLSCGNLGTLQLECQTPQIRRNYVPNPSGRSKKTQKKANNKTNGIEQTYWIINLSWTNSLVSVSQPAAEDSSAAWPEALSHGDTANLHLRGGGSVVLCSPHWMTDVCSLRYNSFKEKYQTL